MQEENLPFPARSFVLLLKLLNITRFSGIIYNQNNKALFIQKLGYNRVKVQTQIQHLFSGNA